MNSLIDCAEAPASADKRYLSSAARTRGASASTSSERASAARASIRAVPSWTSFCVCMFVWLTGAYRFRNPLDGAYAITNLALSGVPEKACGRDGVSDAPLPPQLGRAHPLMALTPYAR